MKLGKCHVSNFGSYEDLEIDFRDLGLSLFYGKTGSGKSTIPDIPAWVLYGMTAKDGAADDVRGWYSTNETTQGTIDVELPIGSITVTRIRGKAVQNDLYWTEEKDPETVLRGKDMADTQRKIEARLGVSAELYLSGSYFHEFSSAGGFFTSKAKDRREVFEKVATLSLPATLADRSAKAKKEAKDKITQCTSKIDQLVGKLNGLTSSIANAAKHSADWAFGQMTNYEKLKSKAKTFDKDKQKEIQAWEDNKVEEIDRLLQEQSEVKTAFNAAMAASIELGEKLKELVAIEGRACGACGGPKNAMLARILRSEINLLERKFNEHKRLEDRICHLASQIEITRDTLHPYDKLINTYDAAAEDALNAVNPFMEQILQMKEQESDALVELTKYNRALDQWETRSSAIQQLHDLCSDLRGELLKKAVKGIEENCNRILETYFDGEIRVGFALFGDALDMQIQKSGYDCVYKQLSKGQRQLLKLSFAVSIMKAAANCAGVHFDNLWFDESLDGLDADLKVKAFSLFSELETEHGSVAIIDHNPEFQSMFNHRYFVSMSEAGQSEISLDEK